MTDQINKNVQLMEFEKKLYFHIQIQEILETCHVINIDDKEIKYISKKRNI